MVAVEGCQHDLAHVQMHACGVVGLRTVELRLAITVGVGARTLACWRSNVQGDETIRARRDVVGECLPGTDRRRPAQVFCWFNRPAGMLGCASPVRLPITPSPHETNGWGKKDSNLHIPVSLAIRYPPDGGWSNVESSELPDTFRRRDVTLGRMCVPQRVWRGCATASEEARDSVSAHDRQWRSHK